MKTLQIMAAALLLNAATPTAQAADDIIGKNAVECTGDTLTPEVLWAFGRIGSYCPSADGRFIVYTVTYYSVRHNKSHTVIYRMDADGSHNTLLTQSAESESDPCFIQNGQRIAFISRKGGTAQVWTMNIDGTDRRPLTHEPSDVGGFKFSPDERHVILIKDVETHTSIEKPYDDLPLASGMVITDLNYKHWDRYITTIPHLFVAPVDQLTAGESRDILAGEPYECPMLPFGGTEQFNWSPDSKCIVYNCRKKTGRAYAISTDSDIYVYNLGTGLTTNLCKPSDYRAPEVDATRSLARQDVNRTGDTDLNMGYDTNPQYAPDGSRVAWLSMERDGYESDRTRLCVLELSSGRKHYVTESFASGVDDFCWGADSRTLYFTGVWHGTTQVYATDLQGRVEALTQGDFDYSGVVLQGRRLIVKRHSLSAPDDLYALSPAQKKGYTVTALTQENRHYTDRLAIGEVKARWVPTKDGQQELCWVVYPPHFDPSRQYPALLFCQGGPQSPVSQFWSYRWNLQLMAAQGYIVIAPNRRGLPGFGMEWLEAISGDYSGACMQDYLDAIDDLCREPYVDRGRLGCVGASFGGYSVYWLAGHHDKRFKCFIAHDGIFNTQQQYVETEEMWFPNWDLGAAPWHKGINAPGTDGSMPAALIEEPGKSNAYTTSPHLYVDRWDTPILCIHGEKDYRILSSQGQSAFNAAILRGIPAELLLYPDENHWVLKPQNGILWQRTFFRWLDRWLKPAADPQP